MTFSLSFAARGLYEPGTIVGVKGKKLSVQFSRRKKYVFSSSYSHYNLGIRSPVRIFVYRSVGYLEHMVPFDTQDII